MRQGLQRSESSASTITIKQRGNSRLPRIERSEAETVEDESAHLWAVSYSDLLMVLLSFFVLFFSFSKKSPNSVAPEHPKAADIVDIEGIIYNFPELKFRKIDNGQSLAIDFPPDLFVTGKVDPKPEFEELIDRTLNHVRRKIENSSFDVTFIGHSDNTPFVLKNQPLLKSNFDLSALRASRILKRAVELGFNTEQVSVKGLASNRFNERTLSILVRWSKETDQ